MIKRFRFLIPLLLAASLFAASSRQNASFITRIYNDLLHRAPSASEAALMEAVLNAGGQDGVATVITSSLEFRTTEVNNYYQQFLGRTPSSGEVAVLVSLLLQSMSNDDAKAEILASDEYYRKAGGTDHQFLEALYRDILGRPIDSAAAVTLEQALRNGTPRRAVVLLVLRSLEARQALIRMFYRTYLGRTPHTNETAALLPVLQLGGQEVVLIHFIVGSNEYFNQR